MRALAAVAIACSFGAACKGGSGSQREHRGGGPPPAPADARTAAGSRAGENAAPLAADREHASFEPDWQVRIPGEPGLPVLQASVGPVLAGPLLVVGSSAIGFAALDRQTGELVWQRRGEARPGRPAVFGAEVWLPGACAHVRDGRPEDAALGCVERVRARDGELIGRLWVTVPQSVGPDVRARAVATGQRGLLWAGGDALWLVTAEHPTSKLAELASPALAAAQDSEWLWGVTEDRVLAKPRAAGAGRGRASGWEAPFSEPVAAGVAGPLRAGPVVTWVRDGVLEARRVEDGKRGWTAEGRHAYVPGSLQVADGTLFAVALDGGISPVRVDRTTGRRLWRGDEAAGIQVLAAAFTTSTAAEAPFLAVAIRLKASLRDDAVALFDERGTLRGTWPLPEPQRPRSDPPGLAAESGAAYLFYDGRIAARLSVRAH